MEKTIKWGITALLMITASIVSFGGPDNIFTTIVWVMTQYVGEATAIFLIWLLFTSKVIRGLLITLGFYYLTDMFMAITFYVDRQIYDIVNTNYSYLLTLVMGAIATMAYHIYNKKR